MRIDDESVLRYWLSPCHIDPMRIAQDALARPYARYVVLDHFFGEEALTTLCRGLRDRSYVADNDGLNYDSASSRVAPTEPIGRLLTSPEWLRWLHDALALTEPAESSPIIAARWHRCFAHGFWPHVDDSPGDPKRIAVLIYLSDGWSVRDGGLLQVWEALPGGAEPHDTILRWDDWLGRRLDFLENRAELVLELGGPRERPVTRIKLVDQIVPLHNRVVLMALTLRPAIHAVSPSGDRERYALLQWVR